MKNDKIYYKSNKAGQQECMYFPSDEVMVSVPNEKMMEQVLASTSKVLVAQELQDFAKKMSGGQIWFAMIDSGFKDSMGDPAKVLKMPAEVASAIKSSRGIGGNANLDADQLTLSLGVLCARLRCGVESGRAAEQEPER